MVLEKTLGLQEIKLVILKEIRPEYSGRTEAETLMLWPPDAKK